MNTVKYKTKNLTTIWLTKSASDQIASDEGIPSETRLFSSENEIGHVEGAPNDVVRVDNLENHEHDILNRRYVNTLNETRVVLLFEVEKIF